MDNKTVNPTYLQSNVELSATYETYFTENRQLLFARLEELQNAAESIRSRIMATLQANQPQFVRTAEQMFQLEEEVKKLKIETSDLQTLAETLAEAHLGIPKGAAFPLEQNEFKVAQTAPVNQSNATETFPLKNQALNEETLASDLLEKSENKEFFENTTVFTRSKRNEYTASAPSRESTASVEQFQDILSNHQHVLENISILRAASEFLEALCNLQKALSDFDQILESQAYDIAAEHIRTASEIINKLSSYALDEEPIILQDIKLDYLQRRGRLVSRLDEAFIQFFVFQPRQVIVKQSLNSVDKKNSETLIDDNNPPVIHSLLNLSDLFYALRSLNLFEQRIETLAQYSKKYIVFPLFDEVLRASDGLHPVENILVDENQITASWNWNMCKTDKNKIAKFSENQLSLPSISQPIKKLPADFSITSPHERIIPLLQSLMKFVYHHFFRGHPQAMELFGKHIWGSICKKLLLELPSPTFQGSELLKELEISMRAIDLIPSSESRLSNFVARAREALYDQRKTAILSNARELILLSSEDTSVTCVSDATETGSLTTGMHRDADEAVFSQRSNLRVADEKLLKEIRTQKNDASGGTATSMNEFESSFPKDSTHSSDASANVPLTSSSFTKKEQFLIETIQHSASGQKEVLNAILEESDSFMRLPRCSVSRHTHELVQTMLSLLDEAVDASKKNQLQSSQQLFLLVREIACLFIMIRPTSCKVRLLTDPQMCAIFFSDCTYLTYHLMTTPFTHGSKLQKSLSHYCFFLDLILALRKLQESFFMHMMGMQRQRVLSSIQAIGNLRNLSRDDEYYCCEAAVSSTMTMLSSILSCWRNILPAHVCVESFALLVNIFLNNLVNKVLAIGDLSSADVNALVLLLSSVSSQLESLFASPLENRNDKQTPKQNAFRASISVSVNDTPKLVSAETKVYDIKTSIPYWESFECMRKLISADSSILTQQSEKFSDVFNADDLRRLMSLNPNLRQ